MSNDFNPYAVSQITTSRGLSVPQKLILVAVFSLVTFASAITMTAFLFGILVAVAGQLMPPPVNFSALIASPIGLWIVPGLFCIIPISGWLGMYSMFRVLKVQRSLMEATLRRHVLQQQVDELRQSRRSQ